MFLRALKIFKYLHEKTPIREVEDINEKEDDEVEGNTATEKQEEGDMIDREDDSDDSDDSNNSNNLDDSDADEQDQAASGVEMEIAIDFGTEDSR